MVLAAAAASADAQRQELRPSPRAIERLTTADVQAKIDEIGFGRAQILALVATGGVMFSEGSEVLVMGTITTLLRGHWELSAMVRGTMVAVVFVGFAFGNLLSGYIGDTFGRRKAILFAYCLIGTFGFLTGLAIHPVMMVGLRFCVGVGCGVGFPSIYSLIPEVTPSHMRGPLSTLMIGFMPVGELFAAILVMLVDPTLSHSRGHCEIASFYPNLLFPRECTWRSMCELSALPAFFFLALSYCVLEESPQWLCAKGRNEEALETIARMSRRNRRPVDLTFSSRPSPCETTAGAPAAPRQGGGTEGQEARSRATRMTDEEAPSAEPLQGIEGPVVSEVNSREISASELFQRWDLDGDGELSRDEIVDGLVAMIGDFGSIQVDSLEEKDFVPIPRNRVETEAFVDKMEQTAPAAKCRYGQQETEACILKLRSQFESRRASHATNTQLPPVKVREEYSFTHAIAVLMRPPLLQTTLFMFLAHFTKDFSVFGLNYVLPQFLHGLKTFSVGVHLLLMSLIALPGVLIAFAMTRATFIGHIQSMQLAAGVCAVVTIGMLENHKDAVGAPCAFISKSAAFAYFICTVVYTAEVFPTSMRNTAVGFCTCFGRAGSISAPLIFELSHEHAEGSFDIFMFVLAGMMGLIALTAPWALTHETKGHLLDEDDSEFLKMERLMKDGAGPKYGAAAEH